MLWKINEVRSEVHAFDATALLTDEVIAALTRRVSEEMAHTGAEDSARRRDAEIGENRRSRE